MNDKKQYTGGNIMKKFFMSLISLIIKLVVMLVPAIMFFSMGDERGLGLGIVWMFCSMFFALPSESTSSKEMNDK